VDKLFRVHNGVKATFFTHDFNLVGNAAMIGIEQPFSGPIHFFDLSVYSAEDTDGEQVVCVPLSE
jgi:hypothetical protein